MDTEPIVESGAESAFDLESSADRIGAQLFPPTPEPLADDAGLEERPPVQVGTTTTPVGATAPALASAPVGRSVPKSWPKEMHDHWGKTDPKVQEYWETREKQMIEGLEQYKTDAQLAKSFHQVIQPFDPILKAQGMSAPQAVQYLLNAHTRLTQGPLESRAAAYQELGKSLGLQASAPSADQPPLDPAIRDLQQQTQTIQSELAAWHQANYAAQQEKIGKEVEVFASDPSHAHFNEVADDIVLLLKTGLPLQDAYDKAVWANPLTREKELQARLHSETEKQKENARLEALPKARAARANVRSRDSQRSPTEALGSMEDTIKATLQEIKQRVH